MTNNKISLEGTLFLQAFKAFDDNDEPVYMKLLPIISYDFPQIQTVLKHKEISQLIDFLKKAKQVVSSLDDPDNLVPDKVNNINFFLNRAYLEQWVRRYAKANQLNAQGSKLLDKPQSDEAIQKYKQSIKIMPTEDAFVNLADIYLANKQYSLFRKSLQSAVSIANNNSFLPKYESIFKKIQKKLKPYERYLCAKVMIRYGSKDKSAYFDYILEAVRRKEEIDKKIMQDFPESFQKRICRCITFGGETVYQFLKLQKQIIDKLSYPNSEQHKKSKQQQLLAIIDIFYLYLSRACAQTQFQRDKRNFYIQRGLNYNPKSYYLLKQMILINARNPKMTNTTPQNFYLIAQSLQKLIEINKPQRIFDRQLCQIMCGALVQLESSQMITTFVNDLIRQYEKQYQVYMLAAKINSEYCDIEEADRNCQQYLKLDGDSAEYYLVKGHIHRKKKQFASAKECYKKSCNKNKNNFTSLFCLASLYYSQKRYQNCIRLLLQAKKVEHSNIQLRSLYQLKLKALNRLRKFDMANQQMMQLIQTSEIQQISGQIAFSYAEVKFHKGQYKDAIEFYQKALKADPKHVQGRYKLILAQLIDNPNVNEEKMEEMLESARLMINKQKNGTLYLTLYGYLLIRSRRYNEALEALLQSINRNAQSCYAYYHLGRLLKDQMNIIDKSVMDALGEKIEQLSSPAKQYACSFLYLALGSHQQFLYNFDTFFKYYKEKIKGSNKIKKQFQSMFKRLIGNFHYLNAIYPGSDNVLVITAMLYRAIDDDKTVQKYILQFLSKYREKKQPLCDVLFAFYNKNHQSNKLDNYFPFIFQFIFQQMLHHHPWEIMSIRDLLGNSLDRFNHNQAVNSCITNYLKNIVVVIQQFRSLSNQLKDEISAIINEKGAEASIDRCFQRLIQQHLRPKRAYKEYNQFQLQKKAVNYNRIKESECMKLLLNRMKVYQKQIKLSAEGKVQQLLKQVVNLVITVHTFDSLWPFIYYETKRQFLQELTNLISILIENPNIDQSQKKLSNYINKLIAYYSPHQLLEQQPTHASHSFLTSLEDELQSTISSLHRAQHSSQFSLQPPRAISKCKPLEYKAVKPYSNNVKQKLNSSIIYAPSQVSKPRNKSLATASIISDIDEDFNFQDFS